MSDRATGAGPPRLAAVLGPTNTGKTHFAVERMLGHPTGMIGLPLRLLAREVYDRVVRARGRTQVALITGEEKIVPPRAAYVVSTVEAMPMGRPVDFLAVDEIQLCADPERGHVFTQRLLHARGGRETLLLGSSAATGLIRRLLPSVEILGRERLSALTYAGSKKLTRLPRRSAIVAFSAEQVYAVAELIRRQRGGAAVVMGSLSPRTRNAQVALFQSGEVDFLVATDAIGMGLNMDLDHVAFAGLRKFDGRRTRFLTPGEVAQIAGRAGRFRRDGTFGVTGECEDMDEDLVRAVEEHQFQPLTDAEWRSAELDYASPAALLRALSRPPLRDGLRLAAPALDEVTLRALAMDPDVVARARDRERVARLWEVCQTPDFRKVTLEEHVRFVRDVFERLAGRGLAIGRLSDDWMAGQHRALDRTDGEIEGLAQRLAGVRTLAYVANRPDWLVHPSEWQGRMRDLEDRLSDTLHEKLMQRFIDRRTSVLMRSLNEPHALMAGVGAGGEVTVEGQFVGRLDGTVFAPDRTRGGLEAKALRNAAWRAVLPEVARRLGELSAAADDAFSVSPDGDLYWRGRIAGRLAGGGFLAPQVRLIGDLGPEPARARARARLEAFLAQEARRRLTPLVALKAAQEAGLRGLARGLAYRLQEAAGVVDRRDVEAEVRALSQAERRRLRALGVRFSEFAIYCPALLTSDARDLLMAFAALTAPGFRPPHDRVSVAPATPTPPPALAAYGLLACGDLLVPLGLLEGLSLALTPVAGGGRRLEATARDALGLSGDDARRVLKALKFVPIRKAEDAVASHWRRRSAKDAAAVASAAASKPSPFAVLAELVPPDRRRRAPRRRGARGG